MALVGRGLRGAAGLRGQDRLDLRDKRGGAGGWGGGSGCARIWGGAGPEDGAGRGGAARRGTRTTSRPALLLQRRWRRQRSSCSRESLNSIATRRGAVGGLQ